MLINYSKHVATNSNNNISTSNSNNSNSSNNSNNITNIFLANTTTSNNSRNNNINPSFFKDSSITSSLSAIYPSFIDASNFRFIEVNGIFVSSIAICGYPNNIDFLSIPSSIPMSYNSSVSIHILKQDSNKLLRKLSYSIANTHVEKRNLASSQKDIDIISKLNDDSKNIRYEIQINNQEIFFVCYVITLSSSSKETLISEINNLNNKLYSLGITSHILNFRHLDAYISNLPLCNLNKVIENSCYTNMTTSNLTYTFPFFTKNVLDKNGVILGYMGNKLCSTNLFNTNHINSNMCILGSSGSGKSYFTKLMILRHYINGVHQIIFDPENEYTNLAKNLNGEIVNFKESSIFNILQFTESDMHGNDFFNQKLEKVCSILMDLLKEYTATSLINDITTFCYNSNIYNLLLFAIKETYLAFNICSDSNSVYYSDKILLSKKLKKSTEYPILSNIVDTLHKVLEVYKENIQNLSDTRIDFKKNSRKRTIAVKDMYINKEIFYSESLNLNVTHDDILYLIQSLEYLISNFPFLNGYTNISFSNEFISFNLSNFSPKIQGSIFSLISSHILDELNLNHVKHNTLIYVDEVWKVICFNSKAADILFNMFKTIRKLNSGICVITQDISDLFNLENGSYGKSILNNSYMKLFFKTEYSDYDILSKLNILSKDDLISIARLSKGTSMLSFNKNNIILTISSNPYEEKLIKENFYDNSSTR